jgi:uncharacterized membrane protein YeaQ/YmgE (transglycosylase-associated protein family)
MSLLEIVIYVLIAGICGGIARAIAGGTSRGFLLAVVLGFFGAMVGAWLAHTLRLPQLLAIDIGGHRFPIVWSIIGGIVLVVLGHLLMRPSTLSRWQPRH